MEPIKLKICCGMNCLNHGGQELLDFVESDPRLQKYCEIEASTCLDGCDEGKSSPVVMIEDETFTSITPEYLIDLIDQKIKKIK